MSIILRPSLPLLAILFMAWLAMAPARAEEATKGRLVNVAWLHKHRADVVLLDASATPSHMAGHIAGAISADLYRSNALDTSLANMERRMQALGISPEQKIVIYDQGGDMMATRLFFDLYYVGLPASQLFILDGGLAQWRAQGGAVTLERTPAVVKSAFRITAPREDVRVRLPAFLAASGDRAHHAVIDALEPGHHYGEQKFFDRAGHVPHAILMPSADFFNADKTFKSPDEIKRLVAYHGIRPEQVVHSHCGGGVVASVPWFALQFLAGHAKATLYLESQREWLRDDRGLPFWTYSAPQIQREAAWLAGWNAPMLRAFGAAQINLVDVRTTDKYAMGHVPFALNLPAETFRAHLSQPAALAALLGPAGVNPAHEVLIMAESGLTPGAALAFLAFEHLGHKKVSVLMDSVDEWGLRGFELTKAATGVGAPKSPTDVVVPVARYSAQPRTDVLIADPKATRGAYPKLYIASGKLPATRVPEGKVLHLPHHHMLNADGTPKAAKELWKLINGAGVPRHAELIFFADDPAEAAVNYYLFRLMGWPDLKVWAM